MVNIDKNKRNITEKTLKKMIHTKGKVTTNCMKQKDQICKQEVLKKQ